MSGKFSKVNFIGATFNERADFSGATFQQANFSRANFKGSVMYTNIRIERIIDFSRSIFEEYLHIKPNDKGYIIFRMAIFKKPNEIIIEYPLSKVSFLNTNLEGIALIPIGDSTEILDDIILRKKDELSKGDNKDPLKIIYNRSKDYLNPNTLNLEYKAIRKCLKANRMFAEASDIYVKEMRNARKLLRYKKKFENWANLSAHWLYDKISNYGESISRPALFIVLTIFIATIPITLISSQPYQDSLQATTAVALQISSLKDTVMPDECRESDESKDNCRLIEKQLLPIEIVIRVLTLIFLGNLFIALRRRLERK